MDLDCKVKTDDTIMHWSNNDDLDINDRVVQLLEPLGYTSNKASIVVGLTKIVS